MWRKLITEDVQMKRMSLCLFMGFKTPVLRYFIATKLNVWTSRSSSKTCQHTASKWGTASPNPLGTTPVRQTRRWLGWALGEQPLALSPHAGSGAGGAQGCSKSQCHWNKGSVKCQTNPNWTVARILPILQRKLAVWYFMYFIWNLIFK